MNSITLSYNDSISVDFTNDAWFNATEVAASFGKRVNDWLNLDSTQDYIKRLHSAMFPNIQLPEKMVIEKNQLLNVKGGAPLAGGGSWFHPKRSIKFARWLDVDFEIWCDLQIEKILHPAQHSLKPLPEPPTITKAQVGILYNKVAAIAGADNKIRSAVWKRFQNHFALSSYKDLPADKYDEAVVYLEAKQEEYRQGVEMLYVSTKELDLLVRERLSALPSPVKAGEVLPSTQHNSITLTLKPLAQGELIKRWMITQHGDDMVQLWAVGSPEHAINVWREEGYIVIKKDEVSARKLVNDYLPDQMLAPLIEAAWQRLQRIDGGNNRSMQ